MYDYELKLIAQTIEEDSIGNQIPTETTTTVLCDLISIGRNEFYNASQSGLKPSIAFKMHAYEYDNQLLVEFEGKRYKVMRSYKVDYEEIELTCEDVIGQ